MIIQTRSTTAMDVHRKHPATILPQSHVGGLPLRFDMDSGHLTAPIAIVEVAGPCDRESHERVPVLLLPIDIDQLGATGGRLVNALRVVPRVEVGEAWSCGVLLAELAPMVHD